jgi:hypothetical protein
MFEKIIERFGFAIFSTQVNVTDKDGTICFHYKIFKPLDITTVLLGHEKGLRRALCCYWLRVPVIAQSLRPI